MSENSLTRKVTNLSRFSCKDAHLRPMAEQIDDSEVLAVNSVAYMLATVNCRFLLAGELKHVNEML